MAERLSFKIFIRTEATVTFSHLLMAHLVKSGLKGYNLESGLFF